MVCYRGWGGREEEREGGESKRRGPRDSCWARSGHSEPGLAKEKPRASVLLFCGNNLSNSISSLQEAFVGCTASCDDLYVCVCVCARALREVQQPQSAPHKLIKQVYAQVRARKNEANKCPKNETNELGVRFS